MRFVHRLLIRLDILDAVLHRWLVRHSITLLRLSLGIVFLGFGVLKFFPGTSPAEGLAVTTAQKLTLGVVPAGATLLGVAILECAIGLALLTRRWLRGAVYLLGLELVGILSPLVLLPGRLFSGPHNAPTLEGQYVLKDVILVGAAMVVASTVRGGKLVPGARSAKPTGRGGAGGEPFDAHEKVELVLAELRGSRTARSICRQYAIEETDYRRWRRELLEGALAAMTSAEQPPDPGPPPRSDPG